MVNGVLPIINKGINIEEQTFKKNKISIV